MRIASLLGLCALQIPMLAAMEPAGTTPLLLQVGGTYLGPNLREELNTDWGYSVGLSVLIAESALIGVPSTDLNLRVANEGDGQFTSFSAYYAERVLMGGQTWFGFGVGSNYVKLKLDELPGRPSYVDNRWGLAVKGMLGYLITDRVFVEATYHYTGKIGDIDTSSTSLCLGYWF